ncbi:hypothetical protein Q5P01_003554 [Channa striata]|uniref:G-protein coupled receptors family 1 profile domain-containing protein n=1 Tax=Channa striata TaxID=64152 RepID=A0AA88NG83_CHASR|nr:hypothetical protein Q5P01_003554 [Channa striata]
MQILPPRTLLVLLAHAHALVSLRDNGDVRSKEDSDASAHTARTFHGPLGENRQAKARDRALLPGYATGASSAELQALLRESLNSTHPWKRMVAGETRRGGHSKRDFNRTVTPVEDPNAASHWDPTRHHNKRIKLNGGVGGSGTPAGGHYNAPKPSSMGRGDGGGGPEEGDRHKRGTKDEQKKAWKRGRNRLNKSSVLVAQAHSSPWEPIPKPAALTSTDLPFDLFTRRNELFTFKEENPWDATPITPPSSQDFGDEIKNPFYPVTSETYGAYAITCVSGVIFLVGIAGNIAILCIVCQNYYMKSISNSLLANLAVWDFVLIFFCLPMVVFHELTKSWLLGEFTCKGGSLCGGGLSGCDHLHPVRSVHRPLPRSHQCPDVLRDDRELHLHHCQTCRHLDRCPAPGTPGAPDPTAGGRGHGNPGRTSCRTLYYQDIHLPA